MDESFKKIKNPGSKILRSMNNTYAIVVMPIVG